MTATFAGVTWAPAGRPFSGSAWVASPLWPLTPLTLATISRLTWPLVMAMDGIRDGAPFVLERAFISFLDVEVVFILAKLRTWKSFHFFFNRTRTSALTAAAGTHGKCAERTVWFCLCGRGQGD